MNREKFAHEMIIEMEEAGFRYYRVSCEMGKPTNYGKLVYPEILVVRTEEYPEVPEDADPWEQRDEIVRNTYNRWLRCGSKDYKEFLESVVRSWNG